MIHSPNMHTSLDRLNQIRTDNYCGVDKEYSAEEVDLLINQKLQRNADKKEREIMRLFALQTQEFREEEAGLKVVIMPPLPKDRRALPHNFLELVFSDLKQTMQKYCEHGIAVREL